MDERHETHPVTREEAQAEHDTLAQLEQKVRRLQEQRDAIEQKYQLLKQKYEEKEKAYQELDGKWVDLQKAHQEITASFYWRMTQPLRAAGTAVKYLLHDFPLLILLRLFLADVCHAGPQEALNRARIRVREYKNKSFMKESLQFSMPRRVRRKQRRKKFRHPVSFDLFVWAKGADTAQLKEQIRSVQAQTYANWRLYLIGGTAEEQAEWKAGSEPDQREKIVFLSDGAACAAAGLQTAMAQAAGTYQMILDAGDLLHPGALFACQSMLEKNPGAFLYTDTAYFSDTPERVFDYHFKPDFSPVTLRGHNYIGHLAAFPAELLQKAGALDAALDEPSHYDLILRLTECARMVCHIPYALYYARRPDGAEQLPDPADNEKMLAALQNHCARLHNGGVAQALKKPGTFKVNYEQKEQPLVSILIPNKDHIEDLEACIASVVQRSTYRNFELIVIENNSTEPETFAYYEKLEQAYQQVRVIRWEREFNYSAINNFGAQAARGDYILLLNNDVEVITPNWLEEMLAFAQQERVGAVGAMLYYPDNTVQHAGVIVGVLGVAAHVHKEQPRGSAGYHNRLLVAQNLSCVTAACVLIPKKVFRQVNGLNEAFAVAFNDVDLCMRIRAAGYDIVFTPFAELYHFESKSRGSDEAPEKRIRFEGEIHLFLDTWHSFLERGDPYYNPNLTLEREDFSLKYSRED